MINYRYLINGVIAINSKIRWKPLIISLLITLCIGGLSGFLTRNSMDTYAKYNRPLFSPPGFIFPIVWTVLFVLMAISAYLIYTSDAPKKDKANALFLYFLQLIINFLWPIIFFKLDMLLLGFLWIVLLWVVVIFMIIGFYKIRPIAAFLQIPYLLWLSFAAYLNLGIYTLNK